MQLYRSQSHSLSRLSLEAKIDYDHPIVYDVADSSLLLPFERNSIAIITDDKALSSDALDVAQSLDCRVYSCVACSRDKETDM